MKILTFSDSEIWDIFRLLASILHFGNIQLEAREIATVDGCAIRNNAEVGKVATLLEVSLTCDLCTFFNVLLFTCSLLMEEIVKNITFRDLKLKLKVREQHNRTTSA